MNERTYTVGPLLLAISAILWVAAAPAFGQSNALTVPQSIRVEHAAIIERLTKEAARADATGVVAQKAQLPRGPCHDYLSNERVERVRYQAARNGPCSVR